MFILKILQALTSFVKMAQKIVIRLNVQELRIMNAIVLYCIVSHRCL